MSPDFSAAAQAFQLCKIKLPWMLAWLPSCPKWRKLPSGSWTVSEPCRKRLSSFKQVRAAAGAAAGILNEEDVVVACMADVGGMGL
jgi:hypothetical protein